MQKIQCSLCGSIDIVMVDDNVYQCQSCGCKYTQELARKLIVTGEVRTKAIDFEIIGGVLKKYNGEDIKVVVPDHVQKIGENAFSGLTLSSVKLPEGLLEIATDAFSGCAYLESI